jgi:hypothetical protein
MLAAMRTHVRSLTLLLPLAITSCGGGGNPLPDDWITGVPDGDHGASTTEDIDGDGIANGDDNCPSIANADQRAACTYTAVPEPAGDPVEDGLARLNHYRLMVGLAPVEASEEFSRGCEAHVSYLTMLSAELGGPQLTSEEDPSKPYYSGEGAQAGPDSVLSLGTENIAQAIDEWMSSLYHRLPLLHPGLTTVGIAHANEYACIQFRRGTVGVSAPHPVQWPAPDHLCAARRYGGEESPCATNADPLAPGQCPPSGTIATLGLYGRGPITDVTGTLTRVTDGSAIDLSNIYWDGGESAHEQQGYLSDSIALVPQPNTELSTGEYEVAIGAAVNGEPETFRWRFQISDPIAVDVMCDVFGPQGTLDTAVPVNTAEIYGRLCETPHFFFIRAAGVYRARLSFEPCAAAMEIHIYDAARNELRVVDGPSPIVLTDIGGMSYIEVRAKNGASGPYQLTIE